MKNLFGILLGLCVLTGGCKDREECNDFGSTRCMDNTVEVCTTDGVWLPEDDCNEIILLDGGVDEWNCCFAPELDGHVCAPVCLEVGM